MLKALVRHPRQPLSREKLALLARGREFEPFDRSLDVQVSRLRKLVEVDAAAPRYIQTVWGVRLRVAGRQRADPPGSAPDGEPTVALPGGRPGAFDFHELLPSRSAMPPAQPPWNLHCAPPRDRLTDGAQPVLAHVFSAQPCCWWAASWPGCKPCAPWSLSRARCTPHSRLPRWSTSAARRWCTRMRLRGSRCIKTMADQEGVRILPREPGDNFELLDQSRLGQRLTEELSQRLGHGTIVASSVNGEKGLWVGFSINGDANWLLMDRSRFSPAGGKTWLIWLITGRGAVAGRGSRHRPAHQPAAQAAVVCSQPRARWRLCRQPARRGGRDQRNPRGQHRLQPHGTKARPSSNKTAP